MHCNVCSWSELLHHPNKNTLYLFLDLGRIGRYSRKDMGWLCIISCTYISIYKLNKRTSVFDRSVGVWKEWPIFWMKVNLNKKSHLPESGIMSKLHNSNVFNCFMWPNSFVTAVLESGSVFMIFVLILSSLQKENKTSSNVSLTFTKRRLMLLQAVCSLF